MLSLPSCSLNQTTATEVQVTPLNSKQFPLLRGEVHRGSVHIPSPLQKTRLSFTPHQSIHSPGWRLPPCSKEAAGKRPLRFHYGHDSSKYGTGSSSSYLQIPGTPRTESRAEPVAYSSETVPDQELISPQNGLSDCSSYSGTPGKLLFPCLGCENKI